MDDRDGVYVYGFLLRNYGRLKPAVTAIDFCLILHMSSFHYESAQGQAEPSIIALAGRMNVTPRYIMELIQGLEKNGYIQVERRTGRRSVYTLQPFAQACLKADGQTSTRELQFTGEPAFTGESQFTPPVNYSSPPPVNYSSPKEKEVKKKKKEKESAPDGAPKPFDVFSALCEDAGVDVASVPETTKKIACRYCKEMLKAGHDLDRIVRCRQYLARQSYRTEPVDAAAVSKKIAQWVAQGEPAEPAPGSRFQRPDGKEEEEHIPRLGRHPEKGVL